MTKKASASLWHVKMPKSIIYPIILSILGHMADNGIERVRFFDKALNEVKPKKNTCVSFVREEGDKGPLAKDLRVEDPERVARVTARTHYGKVVVRPIMI